MSGESPDVVLYDSSSNALAIQNATVTPANTPALMIAGSDGTNSRYITLDASGRPIVVGAGVAGTPAGGVISIQGVASGTVIPANIAQFGGVALSTGTGASGTGIPRVTVSNDSNVLVTQSGTWTVQPGNSANTTPWLATISQGGNAATVTASNALKVDGSAVTQPVSGTVTANIGTIAGIATEASLAKLTLAQGSTTSGQSGTLQLAAVTTAAPTYTTGQSSPLSLDTTGALRITGSISATNPSVSTTGTAPPASATYIGGSVTTAAPSYTTGQMSPLSLTIAGQLRTDSAYPTGTTTANAPDATEVGGIVTTAPPAYTTGQLNALSLDIAGNLRVTNTSTTTGQATTLAPTYVNNTSNPLSLNLQGGLRIDGSTPIGSAPGADAMYVGALTATAAPAYSTGLMEPLSLTLAGQLRIDSAYPTGTTTANAPDMTEVGGIVTTAAPAYTTGQVNALSLDTAGNLRVTGTSNVDGFATTLAPTYVNNTFNSLSLNLQGGLRIDGVAPTGAAGPADAMYTAGAVTTAPPVYTTGQMDPLSLTTAGGLRTDLTQVGGSLVTTLAAGEQKVAVEGLAASGAALSGNPALIGGSDGVNARTVATDANGIVMTGNLGYAAAARITGGLVGTTIGFNSAGAAGLLSPTAYTEQASAAVRSLKSSSAADTAAGTGAQKVDIIGFDASMNRLTETVTMNGTTAVATANSYRFIERLTVSQTGSGSANAGTITLFVNNAGGGGTITTIGVGSLYTTGDNQTFIATHYVQAGKTCYIYGFKADNGGVESTISCTLVKSNPLGAGAGVVETTIFMGPSQRYGSSNYVFFIPQVIVGPARVRLYRTSTSGNQVQASFDWAEF